MHRDWLGIDFFRLLLVIRVSLIKVLAVESSAWLPTHTRSVELTLLLLDMACTPVDGSLRLNLTSYAFPLSLHFIVEVWFANARTHTHANTHTQSLLVLFIVHLFLLLVLPLLLLVLVLWLDVGVNVGRGSHALP